MVCADEDEAKTHRSEDARRRPAKRRNPVFISSIVEGAAADVKGVRAPEGLPRSHRGHGEERFLGVAMPDSRPSWDSHLRLSSSLLEGTPPIVGEGVMVLRVKLAAVGCQKGISSGRASELRVPVV